MNAVELIKSGLESTSKGIERSLDGLTAEEISWHPRPDANSIGLILFHVTRSEDSFIMSLIQKKKQLWETGKWYEKLGKAIDDGGAHYTAEQVEKFVVPDMKKLKVYIDGVRAQTLDYLKGMTPEKLDAKIEFPADSRRPPFEPVVGVFLLLNLTHAVGHAGEISYIRGLKRGMDK